MSNQVEKFGLRPYRKLDGTPLSWSPKQIYDCSGYALRFSKENWLNH